MVHNKKDKELTMSFDAFRFRDTSGKMYIHCSVLICLSKDDGSGDCSFNTGCGGDRRKRSIMSQGRSVRSTEFSDSNTYDLQTGVIFVMEQKKGKQSIFFKLTLK